VYVESIILKNYRNHASSQFIFDPTCNVILGNNGQGKSNLIEALYFLSLAKSYRTNNIQEVIEFGQTGAKIEATVIDRNNHKRNIGFHFTPKGKTVTLDHKILNKSSDLFDVLGILFLPHEDIQLICGSPAERRRYLDSVLSKLNLTYFNALKSFKRINKQKKIILKNDNIDKVLYSTYQDEIGEYNKIITKERETYLSFIGNKLEEYFQTYLKKEKKIIITYQNTLDKLSQEEVIAKEIRYRESIFGAHRDNFYIEMDKIDVKKFCSLGEKRLFSVLIKLAEKEYLSQLGYSNPLILVDDAFLELDSKYRTLIKPFFENASQKIMTTTSKKAVPMTEKVTYIEI
jgi:DNA replication and repair protein RecF